MITYPLKRMNKPFLLVSLCLLISLFNTLLVAKEEAPTKPDALDLDISNIKAIELKPKNNFTKISRYISQILSERHYLKPKIKNNDSLSESFLNKYIEMLDANKSYFYHSDIKAFEGFRYTLDDSVRTGHLDPAYDIYNTFQKRWLERYHYALGLLESSFDFEKQEDYEFDRSDAKWMKNKEEMDRLWKQRVKSDYLALLLADEKESKIKASLKKRYKMAIKRISQNTTQDVFDLYINAFALSVEPHATYFSPRDAEEFDIQMKLSMDGIGAHLTTEDVYTVITSLVTGAPAEKSKQLSDGDRIIGVGEGDRGEMIDVIGWRLSDVVDRIRGKAGTKVRLKILPKGEVSANDSKTVELFRERVTLDELEAKSKLINKEVKGQSLKFGVISVPKFYVDWDAKYSHRNTGKPADYKSTTRDVAKFIKAFESENIDGLIIDLRNNGGGALDEAIELTGLFIDKGPVVQQKNAFGQTNAFNDEEAGVVYSGPLAVLVNSASASASEIFAGAIQDYDRGVIVGEQTFGKGTVQSVMDINKFSLFGNMFEPDLGQFKLTTSKFYRVSGESTQHRGVVPDVIFPSIEDDDERGESRFENALVWDTIGSAQYRTEDRIKTHIQALNKRYQERIKTSSFFNSLKEEISEYRQEKQKKTLSLNLKARKKEQTLKKEKRLLRINKRLQEKGLKPIKDLKDFDDSVFENEDAILDETSEILSDLIEFRGIKKVAENLKKKET